MTCEESKRTFRGVRQNNAAKARISRADKRAANPLTRMQELFVEAYLVNGGNASRAAQAAGYSPYRGDYSSVGSKVLAFPYVQAAIAKRREDLLEKTIGFSERIVRELEVMGFSNIAGLFDKQSHLLPLHELKPEVQRIIKSVKRDPVTGEIVEIQLWDKLGALRDMSVLLGLRHRKAETPGPSGQGIPIHIAREILAALNADTTDPRPPRLALDGTIIEDAEIVSDSFNNRNATSDVGVIPDPLQGQPFDLEEARRGLASRKPDEQK